MKLNKALKDFQTKDLHQEIQNRDFLTSTTILLECKELNKPKLKIYGGHDSVSFLVGDSLYIIQATALKRLERIVNLSVID